VQHSNYSTNLLPKIIGTGILSISMAVLPLTLPASAQVNTPGVDREDVIEEDAYEDNNSDWGWLGLLGLIGLAGLAGKKRHQTITTTTTPPHDATPLGRPGYRE